MKSNKTYTKQNKAPQTKQNSGTGNTVVAKIISEFKDRNRADIQKWRNAITMATNPDDPRLYPLQDLFDNLESDGHYISQRNLRKAATLCNDFSIIDRDSGDIKPEKTELFNSEWFYNLVDNLLDKEMKGYTLLELTDPATMEFTLIPRRNLIPTKKRVLLEVGGTTYIDYSTGFENRLIYAGKATDLGIMADLCGQLIWKRNAQQSWAEFAEKFGMPLITATTNKTSPADIKSIENMLMALGEAARGVLPEGTSVKIDPFAGSDAYKVYDMQIERINSEVSKPIVGGTMTTDNGSSRSQSEVHERNLNEKIAPQDRRQIEFIVNGQLLPLMQAWGWDINPETDKFVYDVSFELSLKEHWEIVNTALDKYDIPDKWVSKTFNIPIKGRKTQTPTTNGSITTAQKEDKKPKTGFTGNFR